MHQLLGFNDSFSIKPVGFQASGGAYMKLHSSCGARIRAKTDNFSHETHEKTRNIIFIFVRFRGFRGHQYPIKEIMFLIDQTGRFFGQRRRLYEITPKWHGCLIVRLAAAMAWIKQRTAEYRISNRKITKDGIAALCLLN